MPEDNTIFNTDKPKAEPEKTEPAANGPQPAAAPISNEGGEKTVAKDPKGMFDYADCQTYEVKKGDELLDIAQKYHVAVQQLRYFNHIDRLTWRVSPGQTLYIPNKPIFVPTGK